MMTGMMMKINVSLQDINEMEFHNFKNIYKTIIDILKPKEN